jgi:hypothetical protein
MGVAALVKEGGGSNSLLILPTHCVLATLKQDARKYLSLEAAQVKGRKVVL